VTEDRTTTWLLRIGAALFGTGLVFAVLTFVPFLLGRSDAPTGFAVATMLCPLGFGVALTALVRDARQARRAQRQR
jgi:membrane associated rhomboid family serine protease